QAQRAHAELARALLRGGATATADPGDLDTSASEPDEALSVADVESLSLLEPDVDHASIGEYSVDVEHEEAACAERSAHELVPLSRPLPSSACIHHKPMSSRSCTSI